MRMVDRNGAIAWRGPIARFKHQTPGPKGPGLLRSLGGSKEPRYFFFCTLAASNVPSLCLVPFT